MPDVPVEDEAAARGRIIGTTRPIKPEEKEVMTVAAEIVRRRYHDDVSEELDELMRRWALRLRDAYDAIIEPIRVRRGENPPLATSHRAEQGEAGGAARSLTAEQIAAAKHTPAISIKHQRDEAEARVTELEAENERLRKQSGRLAWMLGVIADSSSEEGLSVDDLDKWRITGDRPVKGDDFKTAFRIAKHLADATLTPELRELAEAIHQGDIAQALALHDDHGAEGIDGVTNEEVDGFIAEMKE